MRRTAVLTFLLLLLAALAAPAPAASEGPAGPRWRLAYEAWKGGFYILRLEAALRRGSDDYDIHMVARTDGLLGWFYPYRLESRTEGRRAPETGRGAAASLAPRRFRVESREGRGDEVKRRRIDYRPDGRLEVRREPAEPPRLDTPPEASLRGTLDPASAVLALIERFAEDGRCAGRVAVYDGKRRYDLKLSDLGTVALRPSPYSLHSGPARHCRAEVVRLAGFRSDRGRMPGIIDFWLAAPLAGGPALPVHLWGQSSYGDLMIHLVAAEGTAQVTEAP